MVEARRPPHGKLRLGRPQPHNQYPQHYTYGLGWSGDTWGSLLLFSNSTG
jgi:hypothetical protein